jgi:uncharacterized iron-regulated protein
LPGVSAEDAPKWKSRFDRDHPLAGRIWDAANARFVAAPVLLARARTAQYVLLGEQHDNPDHHLLEARVIASLIEAGRRPAVVFEMLDLALQPVIDRALAAHADADQLARAVHWERSGWPSFALYRPVFARALAARVPIVAAGLDRGEAMRIAQAGNAALDPELVSRFALDVPLAPAMQQRLRQEMADVHCGLLPSAMLDSMVLVQRARDARLAERVHASGDGRGAVLIAGAAHVRNDRGVPAALELAYGASSLAIGLLEVESGRPHPAAYAAGVGSEQLPFAFTWFTPRASDVDHCAELRKSMTGRLKPAGP